MSAHAHDGHGHDADGHDADDGGGPPELSRRVFIGGLGVGALGLLIPALGWATTQRRELRRSGGDHRQEPLPAGHARALVVLRGRGFDVRPAHGGGPDRPRPGLLHRARLAEEGPRPLAARHPLLRRIRVRGSGRHLDVDQPGRGQPRRSVAVVGELPVEPCRARPRVAGRGHRADQRHRLQPLRRRRQQIEQGRPGQRVGPTAPGRRPGRPSVGQRLVGAPPVLLVLPSRGWLPEGVPDPELSLRHRHRPEPRRLEPPARHRVDARARGDLDDRGAAAARRPHRDLHRAARRGRQRDHGAGRHEQHRADRGRRCPQRRGRPRLLRPPAVPPRRRGGRGLRPAGAADRPLRGHLPDRPRPSR